MGTLIWVRIRVELCRKVMGTLIWVRIRVELCPKSQADINLGNNQNLLTFILKF